MSERYLEDFVVGQTFVSADCASLKSKSRLSQPLSTRSPFTSTTLPRRRRSSKAWLQAVGTPQRLP